MKVDYSLTEEQQSRLGRLTIRERDVLELLMHFGTLEAVGRRLHCTRENIRVIRRRALSKLDATLPMVCFHPQPKPGTQTRELRPELVERSVICPDCGEDFFWMHTNGFQLLPCPKCGWRIRKDKP